MNPDHLPVTASGGGKSGSTNSLSGQKSKKKKRGKKKDAGANDAAALDLEIQELEANNSTAPEAPTSEGSSLLPTSLVSSRPILAIEPKNLRADEELRRIFGSKVIRTVDRRLAQGGTAAVGNRMGRRAPGGAGRRGPLKRGLLVEEKEHWPPAAAVERGLTMEYVREDSQEGTSVKTARQGGKAARGRGKAASGRGTSSVAGGSGKVFRYVRSAYYSAVQAQFEGTVSSHDPNMLAMHVAQHPYHAEGLLALADVYRQVGGRMGLVNLQ